MIAVWLCRIGNQVSRFWRFYDPHQLRTTCTEARSQMAHFIGFTAVQGNAFGMLADAHERKTEISLELLLVKIESIRGPADDVGEPCAHHA